jgi:hypothetical protein
VKAVEISYFKALSRNLSAGTAEDYEKKLGRVGHQAPVILRIS